LQEQSFILSLPSRTDLYSDSTTSCEEAYLTIL